MMINIENKKCGGNNKLSIDKINKRIPNILSGYYCISNDYISSKSKLLFRCPNNHIVSVKDGFDNNIDVGIISSPVNLKIVGAKYNNRKSSKSDMSISTLVTLHKQFFNELNQLGG